MSKTIYAVYANVPDRRYLLGFAIGQVDDICAYYDDKKAYGLDLEKVDPLVIPAGFAVKRKGLLAQRDQLQAQLDKLNKELKCD